MSSADRVSSGVPDYRDVDATTLSSQVTALLAVADEQIATAVAGAPSFDKVLGGIEQTRALVSDGWGRFGFLGQVGTSAELREAGREAGQRLETWSATLPFRDDVAAAVRAVAASGDADELEGEDALLLQRWLQDLRRAGHELRPEDRGELEALQRRLVELQTDFGRNVNDYEDGLDLTREQLAGLPEDYISRLPTGQPGQPEGTYRVSLDYPDYYPFLEQARDRDLRRELLLKNFSKAAEANRPILEEALRVRRRIAELLGADTWAHVAMEQKMAGSPERVFAFYDELVPTLQAAAEQDVARLTEQLHADGFDGPLQSWDWSYYDAREQERLGVDQEQVAPYLPLDRVLDGLFAITGEVFGLDYREVDDAHAWHPDVRLFEILDRSSGRLLARFYADLFPRPGKYGHAAAFPLVVGHERADGSYEMPLTAIVANFTPPAGERPSLLRHGPSGEVETLWHEFGHVLHMSLTQARYARFSAANTEWDFVEAPSQIMEHWTWEPEVLARISGHYETGEPLPADLVDRLRETRYVDVGLRMVRQVFLGRLDLALHGSVEEVDPEEALRDAYALTLLPYPEGTFFLGSFGHLMGGYDAGYYGYLWAQVIGDDLFSRFRQEGVLSPELGAQWRATVLEPNGSRPADQLVRDFLGREPTPASFLEVHGLSGLSGQSGPSGSSATS
ncbi:MAG: M3 family metallopeptidase [Actinomycetales bacterium]